MRSSATKFGYRRLGRILSAATALLITVGCQGERVQSSLHPGGPAAEAIARLWWVLLGVLGSYTLAVFVLAGIAIFRRPPSPTHRQPDPQEGQRFILIGGAILPALILVPTLAYTVHTTTSLRMRETGLTIRIVGHRWWWEVSYPEHAVEIANELVIPAGEPVRIELASADVIHSFWVPQLHGKMDLVPGKVNAFWLQAERPGIYRGQCAEYCGQQHALMAFVVKVLEPAEFVQWLRHNQQEFIEPTAAGTDPPHGLQLFLQHGCGVCHQIRRTEAQGQIGPDLTLLAERHTLAAGTLANHPDNLLRWLSDPQSIKPGANMPATAASRAELRQIVDYLLDRPSSTPHTGDERDRR